jgi:hypothetical protein
MGAGEAESLKPELNFALPCRKITPPSGRACMALIQPSTSAAEQLMLAHLVLGIHTRNNVEHATSIATPR